MSDILYALCFLLIGMPIGAILLLIAIAHSSKSVTKEQLRQQEWESIRRSLKQQSTH